MSPERAQDREILDIRVNKEEEFPTDPEKRFEAVFSAIGNSEAKCLTLLCLSDNPITITDLHNRFIDESSRVWETALSTQASYCDKTLIPIGLVSEADIVYYGSSEYVTGYRLTNAGKKYGQPIAAYLIQKSADFAPSLYKIFGPTSKGGGETRSVINRTKILKELCFNTLPQRRVDLVLMLNINEMSISKHLELFAQLGLVIYTFADPEIKGLYKYRLKEQAQKDKVVQVLNYRSLTGRVADLIFKYKTVDRNFLVNHLKDKYPKRPEDSLASDISAVLSGFIKQDIVEHEFFVASKIQSQVQITLEGKRIVEELIQPIENSLADNEELLNNWRKISWRNYISEAIIKHKDSSGHSKQLPQEELYLMVLEVIRSNPGIRPKEIRSQLHHRPDIQLRNLVRQSLVRAERQGKAVHYYAAEVS